MNNPALFDSHCHFDFPAFDSDRLALWQQSKALGLSGLIMPGVSPEQWPRAARWCRELPGLFYAAGIHPHWIEHCIGPQQRWQQASDGLLSAQTRAQIATVIGDDIVRNKAQCVAVGECGLDKLIAVPLALQQQLLGIHIELANQLHKPLIIHSVKTHSEILACFKQQPPRYGGVIHAFSGSLEMAQQFIARDFLLGVGGTITYARAQKTREVLRQVPIESVLLETDAPDMPLCGKQGARNSPHYLPQIAQCLAELRGISLDDVAQATRGNARRLFGVS